MNTGWWEIDIHGCYSLVKIAFAPICACKNNRRIWRHNASISRSRDVTDHLWWRHNAMLCTAQLPGPVLQAFGWVQISPFQMADKPPMITDQHTAGGSVSQLSQLAKLSPWLTLSTKDITTSFSHYKKLFCFLSNQIMGLYHFSNPIE